MVPYQLELNMNLNTASDCLTHVAETTEMTFDTKFEALEQAEIFTNLGFEVDGPTSFDGESFTVTISR